MLSENLEVPHLLPFVNCHDPSRLPPTCPIPRFARERPSPPLITPSLLCGTRSPKPTTRKRAGTPRARLVGVRRFSGVVLGNSLLQLRGYTRVSLCGVPLALQQIDDMLSIHVLQRRDRAPSSARITMLRRTRWVSADSDPARLRPSGFGAQFFAAKPRKIGGGGGNRTRVRKPLPEASTCLSGSSFSRPRRSGAGKEPAGAIPFISLLTRGEVKSRARL